MNLLCHEIISFEKTPFLLTDMYMALWKQTLFISDWCNYTGKKTLKFVDFLVLAAKK